MTILTTGTRRVNLFLINPVNVLMRRQHAFGFRRFSKCSCGCTPYPGWVMNFLVFGVSVEHTA